MGSGNEESSWAPRIALTVGDPSGIGPEVVPAAVRAVRGRARVLVLGHGAARPPEIPLIEALEEAAQSASAAWFDTGGPGSFELGQVQASCGQSAIDALRCAHGLALGGRVDAVVTGPVNKAAFHAAGTRVEGQTELLSQWCGAERTEMIGLAGALRVMLATRHLPLREAISKLNIEHVEDRLRLFDEALRFLGVEAPSIALAGLNPHAGEGGLLGSEEIEILEPAADRARRAGVAVVGPVSPDSVFYEAVRGRHDGVLALYHDQAFIPLKLMADGKGVTFIAGLPYLRFSPMHGTAFDIVGQKRPDGEPVADPANLIEALEVAIRVVSRQRQ